ncbi:MAG: 3-deoxy-manno-octulosonate cytidylyltransferase [Candidatus Kapaibacteriota bacterium]
MDALLAKDVRNSVGIIPARLESTRLPRKLLLDLEGKPVLQWTLEGVSTSKYLREIIVATDSDEIADLCISLGFDFILTPKDFASGTERVLWAYQTLENSFDYVVNIQGDEPLIKGEIVDNLLIKTFQSNALISTLVSKITNNREIFEPSTVKVVTNLHGFALYFSRAPIPFVRDYVQNAWHEIATFYKHVGIYCFAKEIVQELTKMPPGKLEHTEKLEQLRWLENAFPILCVETSETLLSIDTSDDMEKAREVMRSLSSR